MPLGLLGDASRKSPHTQPWGSMAYQLLVQPGPVAASRQPTRVSPATVPMRLAASSGPRRAATVRVRRSERVPGGSSGRVGGGGVTVTGGPLASIAEGPEEPPPPLLPHAVTRPRSNQRARRIPRW
jgi:hypothetical protein